MMLESNDFSKYKKLVTKKGQISLIQLNTNYLTVGLSSTRNK